MKEKSTSRFSRFNLRVPNLLRTRLRNGNNGARNHHYRYQHKRRYFSSIIVAYCSCTLMFLEKLIEQHRVHIRHEHLEYMLASINLQLSQSAHNHPSRARARMGCAGLEKRTCNIQNKRVTRLFSALKGATA